jgi:hypothetical protein
MPNCRICGRWIDAKEDHKKDKQGYAYCWNCKGPHTKPGPQKGARPPGKPIPRKVSFDSEKKPELKRLGAGWRCPDCRKWVTGPEHTCPAVASPSRSRGRPEYNPYVTAPSRSRGRPEYNPYVTAPSRSRARSDRSSSEAQYLKEIEANEGRGPAPVPPIVRGALTEEEKKAGKKILKAHRAARGRGKLRAAIKNGKAIRGIGYDVDPDKGFVPAAERKEAKGSDAYKHLEPDYIWEAIDPHHRLGGFLNARFREWLANCDKLRMSFWDYLERPEIKAQAKQLNPIRYIDDKDLPSYKIWVKPQADRYGARLHQGRTEREAAPFDASKMMLLLYGHDKGWALYVQDMAGNIYSGPAYDLGPRGEGDEKKRDREGRAIVLHHSSFLRGKPVSCAGEWMVENGRLICISMMTGHYKTKVPQFRKFLIHLASRGLNLKRITVKWPCFPIPDGSVPPAGWVKYYRASDIADMATSVEYMQEPTRDGSPLEPLGVAWGPPSREKPPRRNKPPTEKLGEDPYATTLCTKCRQPPAFCECGICTVCNKSNEDCACLICSQCGQPDRECKCD